MISYSCIFYFCLGADFTLGDFLKWFTGSNQVPPLGFPKPFSIQFLHGCREGCRCRPIVSTCDITLTLPVHIRDEVTMHEMLASAINDSKGFDRI